MDEFWCIIGELYISSTDSAVQPSELSDYAGLAAIRPAVNHGGGKVFERHHCMVGKRPALTTNILAWLSRTSASSFESISSKR